MSDSNTLTMRRLTISRMRITEAKKAELDAMLIQIINAQAKVDEKQTILNSLSTKVQVFSQYLKDAETNRTTALSNLEFVLKIKSEVENLEAQADFTQITVRNASEFSYELISKLSDMVRQLVFAAEVVNKFSNAIVRKKALNPLISNELVELSATMGKDANTAVALSLTALKSAYTANLNSLDAQSTIMLSKSLLDKFVGKLNTSIEMISIDNGLVTVLKDIYAGTKENYQQKLDANQSVLKQFSNARTIYDAAASRLASLQAGYAAASAAALAN